MNGDAVFVRLMSPLVLLTELKVAIWLALFNTVPVADCVVSDDATIGPVWLMLPDVAFKLITPLDVTEPRLMLVAVSVSAPTLAAENVRVPVSCVMFIPPVRLTVPTVLV